MSITILKKIYAPKVSEILIDKIAVVFDTPYSLSHFSDYLKVMPEQKFSSSGYYIGIRLPGADGYHADTSNRTSITLQVGPKEKNSSKRQCRLEFNPSKVPPEYVAGMLSNELHINYFKTVLVGTVTKIDLAVDVVDVAIDQLLFRAKKYSVLKNHYANGRTLYIGGNYSKTQFRIYDKAAEVKAKNKKTTHPALHEQVPDHVRTRIELSTKPNKVLSDLGTLSNPFEKLRVSYIGDLKKSQGNDMKRLFTLFARHVGVYAAYMNLSQAGKKEIDVFLSEAEVAWWQPGEIWKGYPSALSPMLMNTAISCKL